MMCFNTKAMPNANNHIRKLARLSYDMNQILNQRIVIYQWLVLMYVHKELKGFLSMLRLKVCQRKRGTFA